MACQEKAVQQMTKRIIDINGDVVVEPEYYHSSLDYVQQMVDKIIDTLQKYDGFEAEEISTNIPCRE